jgi:hypothetical protein
MSIEEKNILECKQCNKEITIQSKSGLCRNCVHCRKNLSIETLAKQSAATSGKNNPMYGKTGEKNPMYGKTGEKNPMFGKKHTPEALAKNRAANSGKNNGMYGKHHTNESKIKISIAKHGKKLSPEIRAKMGVHRIGKKHSIKTLEKMRSMKMGNKNPVYGISRSVEAITKQINAISGVKNFMYGKHHTSETRHKLSDAQKGSKSHNYGKSISVETKRKMRLSAINRISKHAFDSQQVIPNWNPIACEKIDEYGKYYGYNFHHASNGGEYFIKELGYWVDGYDEKRNTVIEYYEKKHNSQVQKDFQRETEICNHLGCDFIILWE